MPVLHRFVIDLVCDEKLSKHRMRNMAQSLSENLYVIVAERDDHPIAAADKSFDAHVHEHHGSDYCEHCVANAQDSKNGEALTENVVTG